MTFKHLLGSLFAFAFGVLLPRYMEHQRRSIYSAPFTDEEASALIANHTFLHIGGQHRGGTTFIWGGLKTHPSISSFSQRKLMDAAGAVPEVSEGSDGGGEGAELHPYMHAFRSEGVFLQSVLPKFSLHHPWPYYYLKKVFYVAVEEVMPWAARALRLRMLLQGLGYYAFDPRTHLTEHHRLANGATARNLFRDWAVLWDLERPVLLEKSPSNARIPRLLNELWSGEGGRARFVFVTRHPIMQGLAIQQGGFSDQSLFELVEHWLAVEESLQADLKELPEGSYYRTTLEEIAKDPLQALDGVFAWLGLPETKEVEGHGGGEAAELLEWAKSVDATPNHKYEKLYSERIQSSAAALEEHCRIKHALEQRLFDVAEWYSLDESAFSHVADGSSDEDTALAMMQLSVTCSKLAQKWAQAGGGQASAFTNHDDVDFDDEDGEL